MLLAACQTKHDSKLERSASHKNCVTVPAYVKQSRLANSASHHHILVGFGTCLRSFESLLRALAALILRLCMINSYSQFQSPVWIVLLN